MVQLKLKNCGLWNWLFIEQERCHYPKRIVCIAEISVSTNNRLTRCHCVFPIILFTWDALPLHIRFRFGIQENIIRPKGWGIAKFANEVKLYLLQSYVKYLHFRKKSNLDLNSKPFARMILLVFFVVVWSTSQNDTERLRLWYKQKGFWGNQQILPAIMATSKVIQIYGGFRFALEWETNWIC